MAQADVFLKLLMIFTALNDLAQSDWFMLFIAANELVLYI